MADTSTKEMTIGKLRVNEIIVGPEDGEHITLDPHALWLWRGNKTGPAAALYLTLGRPHLSFYDANGKERVTVFLEGDGTPNLFLQDGNGTPRLLCYLTGEGIPFLVLGDGARKERLEFTTDVDDFDPIMALKDKTGETALEIALDAQGEPSLMVRNKQGTRVPWLTAERKEG
jgi:hypothetical protein